MSAQPVPALAERLHRVQAEVADAARAAHRDPGEITTIVVTKFHPAALVRALYGLGVRDVGESRHQEAQAKAAELSDLAGLTWHFIGQLQANKARQVKRYARVIHSVDRSSLVDALASDDTPVDVFVQLNLTDDPARGGVRPDALESLAEQILARPVLTLRGVMAVAPLGAEPARAFGAVRAASQRLRALAPQATAISAGMSGDFAAAIAAGATHLRIGTAITGNRPERP
ncbi:YggS family pyridoxal phosphate-dependent enzyme [Gryllotalpicola sp.]|uniref:YggS family pyridoxal phosphate-dependent enzyme n=1 Tax=Gryllotalpicola sp. TaxID=1932787 RepID=UPI00261E9FA4|nr:YggS family pyridoxal phosphate-dependent enzyme [Gryllotalpicola sp.]